MDEQRQVQVVRKVPVLVRVIAVLSFVQFVGSIIVGMYAAVMLSGGVRSAGTAIFAGLILILFIVAAFLVCRGLYIGKRWARIAFIVLSFLAIATSIRSILLLVTTYKIIAVAINIAVTLYLLLSKRVKEAFV